MPITTHSNKIVFRNTLEEGVKQQDEEIDFGQRMINSIDVQFVDTNLYMSKELWLPFGSRGAFGGQVVAQALLSGWNTVEEGFNVHSLHAYFILACNVEIPVIYQVERIRDGRSFVTRTVTATQKGKPIFLLTCSFVKIDDNLNMDHQIDMPDVPGPENFPSDLKFLGNIVTNTTDYPVKFRKQVEKVLADDQPVDYREVHNLSPLEIMKGESVATTVNRRWFKTRGPLTDDMRLHACVIAYASDSGFLNTAAKANGVSYTSPSVGMMTSLDHSIWFHKPTRADEWLLFDKYSPRSINGRSVVLGKIYTRDGCLVATAAQEGIIRLSEIGQKKLQKKLDLTDSKL
ncbi:HotDog domain-containing protein [Thamnidium elegans]|nr:HotDog domain-containing protein [Thamnidium elegans]